MMNKNLTPWILASLVGVSTSVFAEEPAKVADKEDTVELDKFVTEKEVEDNLGILQNDPVDSVFGFDKTIVETPRSVSSVGAEFMQEYHISSINDIATFVPGAFTTSFFGVAGSLDLRGTPGDNYFRGVKRINNDGVYPTAIGASDRIDVIRGPMSPISGPSRVGGALNFVPKSSRAETGAYLKEPTGEISIVNGSFGKSILKSEVGGPMEIGSKKAGYYIYAEVEASDSYYRNDFTDQTVLQGSFNAELTDTTRIEFGGMTQKWNGHENGGWNRVTQDLIDHGTYITGQPAYTPPDTNGDGLMNDSEIVSGFGSVPSGFGTSVNCYSGSVQLFCGASDFSGSPIVPSTIDPTSIPAEYGLNPATVGTAKLDGSQVLITPDDLYRTEVGTWYFDIIHDMGNGWNLTNKAFYETVKSKNIDSYGFSKIGDTSVFEDQLIFTKAFITDNTKTNFQASPSIRYVDAYYANDFVHEVFDRVDLTVGFNPSSQQSSPIRSSDPWGINDASTYTQVGMALLTDITLYENIGVLLGARYDYVDISAETKSPAAFFARTPGEKVDDTDTAVSYNVSLSYKTPIGLIPYVTHAEQSTILAGTHDAVQVSNVSGKSWLGTSTMSEAGVKGKFFNDRLYIALASYEQERKSINSNVAESNEALKTEGSELEIRYLPTDSLSLMASASHLKVYRTDLNGALFTFLGAADVPQLDPASIYGGVLSGVVAVPNTVERGGIPENVYSFSARYAATDNWSGLMSVTHVDKVMPSPLGGLVLPAYNLVNASLTYETSTFRANFYIGNLLDEQYFRANFPGLYGNLTVLPELPRNYTATLTFKF